MASHTKEGKKEDRLSRYFKDLDEDELGSESSEDEGLVSEKGGLSPTLSNKKVETSLTDNVTSNSYCVGSKKSPSQKLPSALECFGNKNSPSFLKLNQRKEINWDNSHKNILNEDEDKDKVLDFKTNCVPPPQSYEPMTDPGIKVVDSEGRKRKNIGDDPESKTTPTKTHRTEELHNPEAGES